MMQLDRRSLLGASLLLPLGARAQTAYPTRVIKVVVPYPAGGGTDVWARAAFEAMQPELAQPIIVENRGGNSGMIGTEAVAKAEPDGYQLLFTITTHVQAPITTRRFPYRPIEDFAPIGQLCRTALVLCVGPKVPAEVKTLPQFVAWAKGRDLSLGTYALGSHGHAFGVMLGREAKLNILNVPYRGEAPSLQDILAGSIDGGFHSMTAAGEMVRSGKVRALAVVATNNRLAGFPDLPTMMEFGYSNDFDYRSFAGLLAPARTPQPILDKLTQAFRVGATSPQTERRLIGMDAIPAYQPPAEFRQTIERSFERWTEIVNRLDLRVDG